MHDSAFSLQIHIEKEHVENVVTVYKKSFLFKSNYIKQQINVVHSSHKKRTPNPLLINHKVDQEWFENSK